MKVGRFEVFREIARGGMGTVHLGRMTSEFNVGRVVAIKRLHAHVASDPQFVRMFLDEARLCARIRHRNVVSLLDLVSQDEELYMVLEYVEGETLAKLLELSRKRKERVPDAIVAGVMAGALHGLHAAHEATAEDGSPLGIVHRDFTPQNVLVGVDGAARVADFGVAKAAIRLQTTRDGQLKGKLGYMAPEQISAGVVDRRTDVFAAGAVIWEALAQRRLFTGESEGQILMKILRGAVDPPSDHVPGLPAAWDGIVERALALSPDARFATARDMALAIEASFPSAPASQIGEWVAGLAEEALHKRAAWLAEVERAPRADDAPSAARPIEAVASVTNADPSATVSEKTAVATPDARSGPRRPARVARTAGLALVAVAAVAALALTMSRGSATTAPEAASSAAPERVTMASTSSPAPAASSDAAPVVEPGPSASAPVSAATSTAATVPPVRARAAVPKPAAPAASAGCRYYDAQEAIWKFKKGCAR